MTSFVHNNKKFHSPAGLVLKYLNGKWKFEIIEVLSSSNLRYKRIQEKLSSATPRILSIQLKSLIEDGFVKKKLLSSMPAIFEYTLTEQGNKVIPIIGKMNELGISLIKDTNVKIRLKL